jgi:hypothetical protein
LLAVLIPGSDKPMHLIDDIGKGPRLVLRLEDELYALDLDAAPHRIGYNRRARRPYEDNDIALRRTRHETQFSSPDWLPLGSHFVQSENKIL